MMAGCSVLLLVMTRTAGFLQSPVPQQRRLQGVKDDQMSWHREIRGMQPAKIFDLFQAEDLDPRNHATAVHRIAKSGYDGNDERFKSLADACEKRVAKFSAQDLAITAWGCAKAGLSKDHGIFDAIETEAVQRIDDFNSVDISSTAWAFAKAQRSAGPLFDKIAERTSKKIDDFDAQSLANTAWAFATVRSPKARLFLRAMARTADVDTFTPQQLASTAWALATVGFEDNFLTKIATAASRQLADFEPQGIANLAWALAKSVKKGPNFFDGIAHDAVSRIQKFNHQDLANLAWAFATAGGRRRDIAAPVLFKAIAPVALEKISEFDPLGLANLAWAFAAAPGVMPLRSLFLAIADEAEHHLQDFDPPAIANIAWAFATVDIPAPNLFKAIAALDFSQFPPPLLAKTAWAFSRSQAKDVFFAGIADDVQKRVLDFERPHDLATIAWAFATAEVMPKELFDTLAKETAARIGLYTPPDLTMAAEAFAKTNATKVLDVIAGETIRQIPQFSTPAITRMARTLPTDRLFKAIAIEAGKRMSQFTANDMASLAEAFSRNFTSAYLFDAMAVVATQRIKTFRASDIARMAAAFATSARYAPHLFDAIANEVSSRNFSVNDLATIAWAFACVDSPSAFDLSRVAFLAADAVIEEATDPQFFAQLHLVELHNKAEVPPCDTLDAWWMASTGPLLRRRQQQEDSRLHDVSATLKDLWDHYCNYETDDGLMLDAAQEASMQAVQVFEPSDFLRDVRTGEYVLNGGIQLEQRILRKRGWNIASVSFFEWDEAMTDLDEEETQRRRRDLLLAKLQKLK